MTESEIEQDEIPFIEIENSEGVRIFCLKAENSEIIIKSKTDQIIYYLVIELETSRLVDISSNYTEWHAILPNETIIIPYEDIDGYDVSATEAWIIWVLEKDETSDSMTITL